MKKARGGDNKMRKLCFLLLCLTLCIGMTAGLASADVLSAGETNKIFFKDFEVVFEKVVDPDTGAVTYEEIDFTTSTHTITAGDIFLGIIDVQEVTAGGTTYWDKDAGSNELTGVFIQEVQEVYTVGNDPFPNTNLPPQNTDDDHIVLGAAPAVTLTTLAGDDIAVSDYLTGNEIIALYRDMGLSTFSEGGAILSDVQDATDGSLWATMGYSPGADGVFDDGPNTNPIVDPNGSLPVFDGDEYANPSSDNDGYFYSHVSTLGSPTENFTGELWAGLNLITDNTGYGFFTGVADGTELEYTGPFGPLGPSILFDLILSGEFEMNEEWIHDPVDGGYSNWVFASNDPGIMAPGIPEPATLLLLGRGLVGLAGLARRRKKKNLS
jgi:hypothetical protein